MLSTSTLTAVATAYQEPFEEIANANENQTKWITHIKFDAIESMGVASSNSLQEKNQATETQSQSTLNIKFSAVEKIGVSTEIDDKKLAAVKQLSDRKAIMEKIWNAKRIRFTGMSFVTEDQLRNQQESYFDQFYELADQTLQELLIDLSPTRNLPILTSSLVQQQTNPMQIVLVDANGSSISSFYEISKSIDQGLDSIHDFTSVNNPAILLLLVPIAGYIFVRAENVQLKFYNYRKISSFVLSLILLSWGFSLPLSISTNSRKGL